MHHQSLYLTLPLCSQAVLRGRNEFSLQSNLSIPLCMIREIINLNLLCGGGVSVQTVLNWVYNMRY